MSTVLPPLSIPTGRTRKDEHSSDVSLPPFSSISSGFYARSSLSSSPARSSSPPATPFLSRSTHNYAHIQSSPLLSFQNAIRGSSSPSDYPPTAWDRPFVKGSTDKSQRDSFSLPSFSSSFQGDDELPPSSEFDASETSEDVDISYHGLYPDHTSDIPSGQVSGHSSEWEPEEDNEDEESDDGFSFTLSDTRATFFRTSAERGLWMSDPIPVKPLLQIRRSAPTSSSPQRPAPLRPISEPAVCTPNSTLEPSADRSSSIPEPSPGLSFCNESSTSESEQLNTSSLVSADDVIVQPDIDSYPSPDLPPSSPPSLPTSPQIPFISPLSSPIIAPSSPLSLADLTCSEDNFDLEGDGADHRLSPACSPVESPSHSLPESEAQPALVPRGPDPIASRDDEIPDVIVSLPSADEQDPICDAVSSETKIILCSNSPKTSADIFESTCDDAPVICSEQKLSPTTVNELKPLHKSTSGENLARLAVVGPVESDGGVGKENIVPTPEHVSNGAVSESLSPNRTKPIDAPSEQTSTKGISIKDSNGVIQTGKQASSHKSAVPLKETSEDRRKRIRNTDMLGPVKKKPRMDSATLLAASSSKNTPNKGKRRLEEDTASGQKDKPDATQPKTKKHKRAGQTAPRGKSSQSDTPKSSLSVSSAHKQRSRVDPETAALDAEMCGMLVESMATSRASSLPISTLYRIVMQSRPSLKAQRAEKEWFEVFERVLSSGQSSRGGSGVFGKVESSFKDDSDRPLEAQWFYVPELDEDQDRATLIRSMMPRPGKRSETKKYKQYYYRPLDKISRWDPEDEM